MRLFFEMEPTNVSIIFDAKRNVKKSGGQIM
jgi:hypothetical protein